jgi:peptide/nickel transport system substrate-binding protein
MRSGKPSTTAAVSVAGACVLLALAALGLTAAASARSTAKPTMTVAGPLLCYAIDPTDIGGSQLYDNVLGIAYESLIRLRGDGGLYGPFVPGLATSWKQTNKNTVITLQLRHNGRFSDGTILNAHNAKLWLDYVYNPGGKNPKLTWLPAVKSVQTVGQWGIRITLKSPDPDFTWNLSNSGFGGEPLSPKAVAQMKANPKSNILSQASYGAGPYMIDSAQTVMGDHCTYVPNPYYYDQSAIKWGKIVTKKIGDLNTGLAAAESGQVDVFWGADPTTVGAAQKAGLKVVYAKTNTQYVQFLDHGKIDKALGDLRVRQALNYAIDRKTLGKALFPNAGVPTSSPDPDNGADNPKTFNYYAYNPTKAKQLLAAAGYGKGLTIKILGYLGGAGFKLDQVAQAVCKYWKAVNVTCDLHILGGDQYSQAFGTNTYDAVSTVGSNTSVWLFTRRQNGTGSISTGLIGDQHGWHDPLIDRLWAKAQKLNPTLPPARALWRQVMDRLITQADEVGLSAPGSVNFVTKRVKGVRFGYDDSPTILEWVPAS